MRTNLVPRMLLLCSLLLVSACHHVPNDSLIVPGIRVGNLELGHDREIAFEKDGRLKAKYNDQGLSIGIRHSILSVIEITRDNYKTAEGIGIGSTEAEIISKYGSGKIVAIPLMNGKTQIALLSKRAIHYPGICFSINDQGKVRSIMVTNEEVD
jgi:hypothetical protein